MDKRPNPYKIPPKFVTIEANEEVPVNHRENFLFWCLGALCALVIGLSLYESEIQERFNLNRAPASRGPASVEIHGADAPVSGDTVEFNPYENFPSLY